MKQSRGAGEDHAADDQHGHAFMPKVLETRTLEQNTAQHEHEIAHGIGAGDDLHPARHIFHRQKKSGKQHKEEQEEPGDEQGLLQGARHGGDQNADA